MSDRKRNEFGPNQMAPTALNRMALTALNKKIVYDLCKITFFPYKSKEPTKLTHMSYFFSLKGLVWSL